MSVCEEFPLACWYCTLQVLWSTRLWKHVVELAPGYCGNNNYSSSRQTIFGQIICHCWCIIASCRTLIIFGTTPINTHKVLRNRMVNGTYICMQCMDCKAIRWNRCRCKYTIIELATSKSCKAHSSMNGYSRVHSAYTCVVWCMDADTLLP